MHQFKILTASLLLLSIFIALANTKSIDTIDNDVQTSDDMLKYIVLANDVGDKDAENEVETESNEDYESSLVKEKKSHRSETGIQNLKIILENLKNKGSMFKTHPFSNKALNKHVDEYLRQIDEISSNQKKKSLQNAKRAVCGSLNGNPAYKWICW